MDIVPKFMQQAQIKKYFALLIQLKRQRKKVFEKFVLTLDWKKSCWLMLFRFKIEF